MMQIFAVSHGRDHIVNGIHSSACRLRMEPISTSVTRIFT